MKGTFLILSALAATASASPLVVGTKASDASEPFSVPIARLPSKDSLGVRARANLPFARARHFQKSKKLATRGSSLLTNSGKLFVSLGDVRQSGILDPQDRFRDEVINPWNQILTNIVSLRLLKYYTNLTVGNGQIIPTCLDTGSDELCNFSCPSTASLSVLFRRWFAAPSNCISPEGYCGLGAGKSIDLSDKTIHSNDSTFEFGDYYYSRVFGNMYYGPYTFAGVSTKKGYFGVAYQELSPYASDPLGTANDIGPYDLYHGYLGLTAPGESDTSAIVTLKLRSFSFYLANSDGTGVFTTNGYNASLFSGTFFFEDLIPLDLGGQYWSFYLYTSTFKIGNNPAGQLNVGGPPGADYFASVDSGTALIILDLSVAEEIWKQTGAIADPSEPGTAKIKCSAAQTGPDVILILNKNEYPVPAASYVLENGDGTCISGFAGGKEGDTNNVLGDVFLRACGELGSLRVPVPTSLSSASSAQYFDIVNNRIGFAKAAHSTCNYFSPIFLPYRSTVPTVLTSPRVECGRDDSGEAARAAVGEALTKPSSSLHPPYLTPHLHVGFRHKPKAVDSLLSLDRVVHLVNSPSPAQLSAIFTPAATSRSSSSRPTGPLNWFETTQQRPSAPDCTSVLWNDDQLDGRRRRRKSSYCHNGSEIRNALYSSLPALLKTHSVVARDLFDLYFNAELYFKACVGEQRVERSSGRDSIGEDRRSAGGARGGGDISDLPSLSTPHVRRPNSPSSLVGDGDSSKSIMVVLGDGKPKCKSLACEDEMASWQNDVEAKEVLGCSASDSVDWRVAAYVFDPPHTNARLAHPFRAAADSLPDKDADQKAPDTAISERTSPER
ncbi:aspartic peptidase domain-containing protein [Blyttiomyces helicus]|uniref:Aspartic peptidase domain-containing protein n=1 Tax=Blyttiomyces helicus TaxID=388810 RepID=A0A4P9WQD2_9FUNG|nr:aspartic peptidase domain-containing protein [Blyttiomyces helicus]|eukprot:RKO94802.1 aspartic peptidase domain-containing protein [Blyttiomyces helicus]